MAIFNPKYHDKVKNDNEWIIITPKEFCEDCDVEEIDDLKGIIFGLDDINKEYISDLFDTEYKEMFTYLSSRYNSNELSIKLKDCGLLPKEM